MAAIFRSRGPRSFRRTPYKLSWILFAALLLLLWSRLPKPRKSHRKHTPHYAVADKPRFLFHSRFRDHPDYEYEATIDNLLRNIEDEAASDSGAILDAKDTVWQIRLDDDATPLARDPSSIKFERANDDWEYQARFPRPCLWRATNRPLAGHPRLRGVVRRRRLRQRPGPAPGIPLLPV